MDSGMKEYFKGLSKEQKKILNDHRLQNHEKSKMANVTKRVVRAWAEHQKEKRIRRGTAFCFSICVALASSFLYVEYQSNKDLYVTKEPTPAIVSPSKPKSESDASKVPAVLLKATSRLEDIIENNKTLTVVVPYPVEEATKDVFFYDLLHPNSPVDMASNEFLQPRFNAMLNDRRTKSGRIPMQTVLDDFLVSGREKAYSVWYHEQTDRILLTETINSRKLIEGSLSRLAKGTYESDDMKMIQFAADHNVLLQNDRLRKLVVDQLIHQLKQEHSFARAGAVTRLLTHYMNHSSHFHSMSYKLTPKIDVKGKPEEPCTFVGYLHNHNWGRLESDGDLANSKNSLEMVLVYDKDRRTFQTRHLYHGKVVGGRVIPASKQIQARNNKAFASNRSNWEPPWKFNMNSGIVDPTNPKVDYTVHNDHGIDFAVYIKEGRVVGTELFDGRQVQIVQKGVRFMPDYIMVIPRVGRSHVQKIEYE